MRELAESLISIFSTARKVSLKIQFDPFSCLNQNKDVGIYWDAIEFRKSGKTIFKTHAIVVGV